MMLLELKEIHAGYGPVPVLRGVSLQLGEGEILGVLGRNGMGKTTLIRCIAGTLPLTQGSIHFAGQEITRLAPHERAQLGLTTVVQGRGVFPRLSVWENLEMGRIAAGGGKRSRLDEVIGYFPRLGERLRQPAGTLSGGEQQMLAIGRALMTHPKLILLDEPSDGIMPILVHQIAEILLQINRREGVAIVIVEQNVPMVFALTDRCVILEKGRVVAEGTREQVSQSAVMREYLAI
ncbi:MAG: ABC transporter ATP-binding protein [Acidobacteriia bacterium]|nr:ABC transporter ATP-binding protein [Methyloceanibacter sp.]MBX5471023.1 ABC transporter ATP-binding protein [Acetobacteraceae bacterium]MCL6490946.1 ABC transporter ATP-binding protein [Terriglobia bacterium]